MLVVGTIGLAGSLNISVMERTSEYGVMKAIGGTHRRIRGFILVEGILLSGSAWITGNVLSLPFTAILSNILGKSLFGIPAKCQINIIGILIGLTIAFVITLIACSIPSHNLSKHTTRELLIYE